MDESLEKIESTMDDMTRATFQQLLGLQPGAALPAELLEFWFRCKKLYDRLDGSAGFTPQMLVMMVAMAQETVCVEEEPAEPAPAGVGEQGDPLLEWRGVEKGMAVVAIVDTQPRDCTFRRVVEEKGLVEVATTGGKIVEVRPMRVQLAETDDDKADGSPGEDN